MTTSDSDARQDNRATVYAQSSAIPFRHTDGGIEVLVISTRGGKRWIVPKGLVEDGLTPAQSAAQEAYEEAGVRGRLGESVGRYTYKKWNGTCHVVVFLLEVREIFDAWPESYFRQRRWLPAEEAARIVRPKGVREVMRHALL